jgi:hypothetical protein
MAEAVDVTAEAVAESAAVNVVDAAAGGADAAAIKFRFETSDFFATVGGTVLSRTRLVAHKSEYIPGLTVGNIPASDTLVDAQYSH